MWRTSGEKESGSTDERALREVKISVKISLLTAKKSVFELPVISASVVRFTGSCQQISEITDRQFGVNVARRHTVARRHKRRRNEGWERALARARKIEKERKKRETGNKRERQNEDIQHAVRASEEAKAKNEGTKTRETEDKKSLFRVATVSGDRSTADDRERSID